MDSRTLPLSVSTSSMSVSDGTAGSGGTISSSFWESPAFVAETPVFVSGPPRSRSRPRPALLIPPGCPEALPARTVRRRSLEENFASPCPPPVGDLLPGLPLACGRREGRVQGLGGRPHRQVEGCRGHWAGRRVCAGCAPPGVRRWLLSSQPKVSVRACDRRVGPITRAVSFFLSVGRSNTALVAWRFAVLGCSAHRPFRERAKCRVCLN